VRIFASAFSLADRLRPFTTALARSSASSRWDSHTLAADYVPDGLGDVSGAYSASRSSWSSALNLNIVPYLGKICRGLARAVTVVSDWTLQILARGSQLLVGTFST
jgi:hypothetical protein